MQNRIYKSARVLTMHKLSMLGMISVALVIGMLSGCGGGSSKGAPHGGAITINPASVTWSMIWTAPAVPSCAATNFHYSEFMITVTDPNGRPVSHVDLDVALDLSLGSSSYDIMRLYDDPTWVSGSATPPTNKVTSSYRTSTGDFGTKRLIVGMNLNCPAFKGYLSIYSGEIFKQAALSVTN